MRVRGLGRVFQPIYKDKKTGQRKQGTMWWVQYSFRGASTANPLDPPIVQTRWRAKRRLSEIGARQLIGPDAEKTTFGDLAQMVLDDYRGAAPPLEYYLSASKPGRYPRKPLGKLQLQTAGAGCWF